MGKSRAGTLRKLEDFALAFGLKEYGVCRLFGAYFAVMTVEIIIARINNLSPVTQWKEFTAQFPFFGSLIWTAIVFAWLSVIFRLYGEKLRGADSAMLIFWSVAFSVALVWRSNNFYLGLSSAAVTTVFSVYAYSKFPVIKNMTRRDYSGIIVFICSLAVFFFVAKTTIDKHRAFGTPCFDMGIFLQMFNSLKENLTALTTCERDQLMSHFSVHSSYIFYLILPIYALIPRAETLLTLQAFFAISGVLPLYLIAKKRGFNRIMLVCISFLYIFCSGLILPCYYSFHENCLLPTLLMWLIYAVERKNVPLIYVMSLLTCLVKEDAALYVICIGAYFFSEEKTKKRIHGLLAAALSGIYFVIVIKHLNENGDGLYMTSSRLGILMTDSDSGFITILKNAVSNPGYFFSTFIHEDTLIFLCETLLPLMLLPFYTVRLNRYLLMVPYVIMCLVIGYGYRYAADIGFQYIFGPICLLIYMAVINANELSKKLTERLLISGAVISLITSASLSTYKLQYSDEYRLNRNSYIAAEECIDLIPKDASVLSNTFLLPHACDRREIYDLGNDKIRTLADGTVELIEPERYDYLLMSRKDPITEQVDWQLRNSGWEEFAGTEDFIIIYKNPSAN